MEDVMEEPTWQLLLHEKIAELVHAAENPKVFYKKSNRATGIDVVHRMIEELKGPVAALEVLNRDI
jgi:hypothetical protein